jgi:putative endonuclease
VLYIGITNNLERRVWEHRHHVFDGFSKQYLCPRLVYFESYARVQNPIAREKQLQRWNRAKKIWLIERVNPTWEDLSSEWGQPLRKQLPPLAS